MDWQNELPENKYLKKSYDALYEPSPLICEKFDFKMPEKVEVDSEQKMTGWFKSDHSDNVHYNMVITDDSDSFLNLTESFSLGHSITYHKDLSHLNFPDINSPMMEEACDELSKSIIEEIGIKLIERMCESVGVVGVIPPFQETYTRTVKKIDEPIKYYCSSRQSGYYDEEGKAVMNENAPLRYSIYDEEWKEIVREQIATSISVPYDYFNTESIHSELELKKMQENYLKDIVDYESNPIPDCAYSDKLEKEINTVLPSIKGQSDFPVQVNDMEDFEKHFKVTKNKYKYEPIPDSVSIMSLKEADELERSANTAMFIFDKEETIKPATDKLTSLLEEIDGTIKSELDNVTFDLNCDETRAEVRDRLKDFLTICYQDRLKEYTKPLENTLDVITSPSDNQNLVYNGTFWENTEEIKISDLTLHAQGEIMVANWQRGLFNRPESGSTCVKCDGIVNGHGLNQCFCN